MSKRVDLILKEVLQRVEPSKEELKEIEKVLAEFLKNLRTRIKASKIRVEIFIGGSFAKKTLIKKDRYDVDVFLRFDKKYSNDELPSLTKKILKGFEKVGVVHGSRDYFRVNSNPFLYFEIIPVRKVSNPQQAENITDLSYSHVNYVKRKVKKDLLREIMIAKAFCHAKDCYGAESYIRGFSGYSLELLVYYYKGFLNFVRTVAKIKEKEIIDIEKLYKSKRNVLMDVNSSKLQSPIILIDPTHKQRNALAALSEETFRKFQKECKKFLKSPSLKDFENKKTDLERIKKNAEKNKNEFVLLEISTDKQAGDIAGSKLLKFYKHFESEVREFFMVKNSGFEYDDKKSARCFFVVKKKKEIVLNGPSLKDLKNLRKFKKKHKKTFVKKHRVYARETPRLDIKDFIKVWKKKNQKRVREMYVKIIKVC